LNVFLFETDLVMEIAMSNGRSTRPTPAALEDTVLLEKIAEGDRKAFKALYIKYQPRLIKFCSRLLKNDIAIAADVADEALIEVWRSAGSFSGKSLPSTWIHSIARFRTIAYLRKNKEVLLDTDLASLDLEDTALSAEDKIFINDRNDLLIEGLGKLSNKHREIIELVYFRELSIKDISAMLNISDNTVKTRMFYARKHLKSILTTMGIKKP